MGVETFYGEITRQVPGDRRARDARLRLPAAQRLLPRAARAVPAHDARGIARPAGAARLLRGRHGHPAVHAGELSHASPSTATATATATCGTTGATCSRASSNYLLQNGWRAGRAGDGPRRRDGRHDSRACRTTGSRSPRPCSRCATAACGSTTSLPPEAPAVLVPLDVADGVEYRVGFSNYYAITRYNRSELYASAVNDLAEAHRRGQHCPSGRRRTAAPRSMPPLPPRRPMPPDPSMPLPSRHRILLRIHFQYPEMRRPHPTIAALALSLAALLAGCSGSKQDAAQPAGTPRPPRQHRRRCRARHPPQRPRRAPAPRPLRRRRSSRRAASS